MRIGLFIPCYIDTFFPEVGIATLELLDRFGHEVVYPRDQTFQNKRWLIAGQYKLAGIFGQTTALKKRKRHFGRL